MIFEYFLLDTINRQTIYDANSALVEVAHELWVFGEVSDGVQVEIAQAKKLKKPIRPFDIIQSKDIVETTEKQAKLEKA